MGNSSAQREHVFVAWIKAQRQLHREESQGLHLVPPVVVAPAAESAEHESEAHAGEHEQEWARRVPNELMIAAAVLGACIGCPIGAAVGGIGAGLLCGFMGALLGELAVLAVARLLTLVLRVVALGLVVAVGYAILHSMRR